MILGDGDLHRLRPLLVIIRHVVDPRAYGIAPPGPCIVGPSTGWTPH
jgi:hypothetical protein